MQNNLNWVPNICMREHVLKFIELVEHLAFAQIQIPT